MAIVLLELYLYLHILLRLHLNSSSHSLAYTVDIHILLDKLEGACLQF